MINRILERLEEERKIERETFNDEFSKGVQLGYAEARKIVQEVAKEYGKDTNVRSNADRIRAMSDEELAEYLSSLIRSTKVFEYFDDIESWLKWLKSEAKE